MFRKMYNKHMNIFLFSLFILISLIVGFALCYFLLNRQIKAEKLAADSREKLLREVTGDLQKTHKDQLENLANEILRKKEEALSKKSAESIEPLKTELDRFSKQMQSFQVHSAEKHGSLEKQIRDISEKSLNLAKEAQNLTSALTGNKKIQGNWGETMLEQVLQSSGLVKDVHYYTQYALTDEQGKTKMPDFILNLPDGRKVIIDSKVSLAAYTRYSSAETEAEKEAALKEHVSAIKEHIKDLSSKDYQALFPGVSPDFVFMFIPIEHAYMEALHYDPSLYELASKNKVAIATSSSIYAMLKVVENLWRLEAQNKNVAEISRLGGALYEKLYGFVKNMEDVGKKLDNARDAHEEAMGKLSKGKGNALGTLERMRKLGLKTSKDITSVLPVDTDDETEETESAPAETPSELPFENK